MEPVKLRQRAAELETDLWSDYTEDRRSAAELLAELAGRDVELLRRAMLGETVQGSSGTELLRLALEYAEDEAPG